jgi:integrase
MYSKAREWGAEVNNPVAGTRRNTETAKERYLLPDELRRFLAAVDEDYNADTRDSLLLLLCTGVRSGTLCRARWQDISLEDGVWHVPEWAMKAGRPLELPLAPAVVAILRKRQDRAEASPWVFPGGSGGHIASPARSGWLRVLKRAGIAGLTRHDLRRTYATYAQEAGVAFPMIAKVLGHSMPGGVTAIYARPTPEKVREGVEKAVEHMLQVAEVAAAKAKGGEVVAFPTRRAKS